MAKGEKFHQMVARVADKNPAMKQALASYAKKHGIAPLPAAKLKPLAPIKPKVMPLAQESNPDSGTI